MSMSIVHHVRTKSQTKGSARTLLLNLAIYANDCCGMAWVSDATLCHDVNVSRQRIHELKNAVEASGELTILERRGYTNLYFVSWQGKPLGPQEPYRDAPGRHQPHCPLQHSKWVKLCADRWPDLFSLPKGVGREVSDLPVLSRKKGVSGISDPLVSGIPDGGRQESLTQQQTKTSEKTTYVNVGDNHENVVDNSDELHAAALVDEIVHQFNDAKSRRTYQRIVRALGCDITYRLLLNTFEVEDNITGSLGAYFVGTAKKVAMAQGIDLGFHRQSGRGSHRTR